VVWEIFSYLLEIILLFIEKIQICLDVSGLVLGLGNCSAN
jgi:hypothetical protein